MGVNKVLDRLPRVEVRLGARVLPTYFVAGLCGVGAGAVPLLMLAMLRGLSASIAVCMGVLACVTFVTFQLARRLIARDDRIVLLEHVYVVLAVAYAVLTRLRVEPLPYLDALTVGLAVFLCCGRIGCVLAGCCFGHV